MDEVVFVVHHLRQSEALSEAQQEALASLLDLSQRVCDESPPALAHEAVTFQKAQQILARDIAEGTRTVVPWRFQKLNKVRARWWIASSDTRVCGAQSRQGLLRQGATPDSSNCWRWRCTCWATEM